MSEKSWKVCARDGGWTRARAEQDLVGRHAAAAHLLAEGLRDAPAQRLGQHLADLFLPVGRELVDDRSTVDGAVVLCRVRNTQVPGLGGLHRDGEVSRSRISPTQHDVRVLDAVAARRASLER